MKSQILTQVDMCLANEYFLYSDLNFQEYYTAGKPELPSKKSSKAGSESCFEPVQWRYSQRHLLYYINRFIATAPHWGRASSITRFLDHTPQSVGLLWKSDQLVAETYNWQHTTLTTDNHPCSPAGFQPTVSADERPQTYDIGQCFSTAGPRPGTGTWHQLHRAARGSPGICHFSFVSCFHE